MSVIQRQRNTLLRLHNADRTQRRQIIQRLSDEVLEAIGHIAYLIVNTLIPILNRDETQFRENSRVLKQLNSKQISNRRKNTLLRNCPSPVLLRPFYIDFAIRRDTNESKVYKNSVLNHYSCQR